MLLLVEVMYSLVLAESSTRMWFLQHLERIVVGKVSPRNMYSYIYIFIIIYNHISSYIITYIYINTFPHICIFIHMRTYSHMYIYIYSGVYSSIFHSMIPMAWLNRKPYKAGWSKLFLNRTKRAGTATGHHRGS